jgi:hypothetical protein
MRRDPLSELRVVNPCQVDWEGMSGTDRVRHCSQCNKDVFNVSSITRAEAAELIQQAEGKVCVRYDQRRDGTVLTRDSSLKDRVSLKTRLALVAVAAALGITMSTGCTSTTGDVAPAPSTTPSAKRGPVVMGTLASPKTGAAQNGRDSGPG